MPIWFTRADQLSLAVNHIHLKVPVSHAETLCKACSGFGHCDRDAARYSGICEAEQWCSSQLMLHPWPGKLALGRVHWHTEAGSAYHYLPGKSMNEYWLISGLQHMHSSEFNASHGVVFFFFFKGIPNSESINRGLWNAHHLSTHLLSLKLISVGVWMLLLDCKLIFKIHSAREFPGPFLSPANAVERIVGMGLSVYLSVCSFIHLFIHPSHFCGLLTFPD